MSHAPQLKKSGGRRHASRNFWFLELNHPIEMFVSLIKVSVLPPESDNLIRDTVAELTVDHLATLRHGTEEEEVLGDEFLKSLPAFGADLSIAMLNHFSTIYPRPF